MREKMREIKFRAWDKEKRYFYYFTLNTMFPVVHQGEMLNKEPPQEFTGIRDKNGKEIYEGDIVNEYGFDKKGIVIFGKYKRRDFSNQDRQIEHLGWYIKPISNFDKKYRIEWNPDVESLVNITNGVEIIGNKYENPELLNGTEVKRE